MIEIILATGNQSKAKQIGALLNLPNAKFLTMAEAGIEGDPVEDGSTLQENAEKKVQYVRDRKKGTWIVADDTGLFIDALDGVPGIHAARWAGESATTEETMEYTLEKLSHLKSPEERMATFKTVAAVLSPEGKWSYFEGAVRGQILPAPRCECQPNMPYSAIFVPEGGDKVWAEMSVEEENSISHRGAAFRAVREYLISFLQPNSS